MNTTVYDKACPWTCPLCGQTMPFTNRARHYKRRHPAAYTPLPRGPKRKRPTIVCLCGSTRFWRTFQQASLAETLAGKIVLSIGAASGTDDDHFGNLPRDAYDRVKAVLDELHLRKIDMADEVLILNVNGYIGASTRRKLAYALQHGKHVRYLEPPTGEEAA